MSSTGNYEGDELSFEYDDEEEAVVPLPTSKGVSFPLPSPLASVLMAWALSSVPDPNLDVETFDDGARDVLLVEEDIISREAFSRLFANQGWSVSEASTVAEGLAALDPPPSCLILDLMLPDGDGAEVLRRIRAEGLPTRVVVTTGVSDESRLRNVAKLQPDSMFRKPIDFKTVFLACSE